MKIFLISYDDLLPVLSDHGQGAQVGTHEVQDTGLLHLAGQKEQVPIMGTLMDVYPSARAVHLALIGDNLADGGAVPSMDKGEQYPLSHPVTVFDLTVANGHATKVDDESEGDGLDVLVPLKDRHVAPRDNDNAEKSYISNLFFSGSSFCKFLFQV